MSKKSELQYSLIKWPESNYEISVNITEDQKDKLKKKTLQHFQKDTTKAGFRKWHVPLDIVESMVQPMYITAWILENLVHKTLKKVIDENPNHYILSREPYDFNPEQLSKKKDDGTYLVTFKVDVYPEVEEKDNKRQNISITKAEINIDEKQIDDVITSIQKQYANYIDTEEIGENTVAKCNIKFFWKDEQELHKKSAYVWDEEFTTYPFLKEDFTWKKQKDTIKYNYKNDKNIPTFLKIPSNKLEKLEKNPESVLIVIDDIKKLDLPELTDQFIQKVFKDSGITTVKWLKDQVQTTLQQNKNKEALQKSINEFLDKAKASFAYILPKTFVDEEFKWRIKEFAKQFWWEEWFKKFLGEMEEQKKKDYLEKIKNDVRKNLDKFFLLKTIIEKLWLDKKIDLSKPWEAEQALYDYYTNWKDNTKNNSTTKNIESLENKKDEKN